MKIFLFSFFLLSLGLLLLPSCCGNGDDGFTENVLTFNLVEKETGTNIYAFGGSLYGELLEIFLDDNITRAEFEPLLDNGTITLFLENSYGQNNGGLIERTYYLHLAGADIDTLLIQHMRQTDDCNRTIENFRECAFNDSTYVTNLNFLK